MDQECKTLAKTWLLYMGAVLLSVAILVATGEKSISPRASKLVDLSASRPGTIAELSKSKELISHVRFFNEAYLSPESKEWSNPPASQTVAASVQQQPDSERFSMLWVSGPTEDLRQELYLEIIVWAGNTYRVRVPANTLVGPVLRNGSKVSFQLSEPQGVFFKTNDYKTQAITFAPNTLLQYNQAVTLDLPVLPEKRAELGQDRLHVQVQLTKFDPGEEKHEAAAKSSDIPGKAIPGALSFDELKVTNNLLITPAGRYTTLIITGDHDLKPYLRCVRTDTGGEVGTYSDHLPMMAVAVNSWASLRVHVSVHEAGQTLRYRIVSLSANEVTTKALLLWFAAHDLTDKEAEGRILSLPEIDERIRWLKSALDVQFTAQDGAGVSNHDLKQVLAHLMTPL